MCAAVRAAHVEVAFESVAVADSFVLVISDQAARQTDARASPAEPGGELKGMRKAQLALYIVLTIFLTVGAVAFVLQSVIAFRTDSELDYGEGIVMWQAANVTNWKKAYHPVEEYPHNVFHYPPLFHLTSRAVAPMTSTLLEAGRLTSILSLAGTCLVGALLVAWTLPPGGSSFARFIGAFTAGTLVFATPVWTWGVLMRVDMLAIFLTGFGVMLFVLSRRRPVLSFLAFVFFVAGVYTKQTSLAAPLACLALAFIERPRRALQLVGFSTALGLTVLAMLHTATNGYFLVNLITYNQNPYYPQGLLSKLKWHYSLLAGPLLFAGLFPVALLRTRRARFITRLRIILKRTLFERCVLVVAVYFWISALIAAATISKSGAWDNYFLEMDILACWVSGLLVAWLARRVSFRPQRAFSILQVVVIFVLLVQCVSNWRKVSAIARSYQYPTVDRSNEVVNFIKQLPGDVYSEDMVILMQAGKEVPAEPAIISVLAEDGKWDESGFVQRIRNGGFSAIVIRWTLHNPGRFREPIARAIEERYYPIDDYAPFKIYLPR